MDSSVRIKVLTYNIQVAMSSKNIRHHVMHSWHHMFPHPNRNRNLQQIARMIDPFDIVALQELDGGSIRSDYVNQATYLAELAEFSYAQQQTTRNLGPFAQHAKALLSRFPIANAQHYALPSRFPGRGLTSFIVEGLKAPIFVINTHLSLGHRAQEAQLRFIAELIAKHSHVIVMGDLNLTPDVLKGSFLEQTNLQLAVDNTATYPSWNPKKQLDYILVSANFTVHQAGIISCDYSDHLPVFAELELT